MREYLAQLRTNLNINATVFLGQLVVITLLASFCLIFGIVSLAAWIVVTLLLALRIVLLLRVRSDIAAKKFSQGAHFWSKKAWNYLEVFTIIGFMLVLIDLKNLPAQAAFVYPAGMILCAIYLILIILQHLAINNHQFLKQKGLLKLVAKTMGRKKKLSVVTYIKNPILRNVFEWVDSIIWAIIAVVIVNSLTVQIYEIPSESMVPTFYVGNRPVVLKTLNNPKIPFSAVTVPIQTPYQRFDIAIIENPRYPEVLERSAEQYLKDLGYMITFSLVRDGRKDSAGNNYPLNQRFTANGTPIVSPLVKRIIAREGEQVMMIDDVLYIRQANEALFQPIKEDLKYAYNSLTYRPLSKIRQEVMTPEWNTYLHEIDTLKRDMDPVEYQRQIQDNAQELSKNLGLKSEYGILKPEISPVALAFEVIHVSHLSINALQAIFNDQNPEQLDELLADFQSRMQILKSDANGQLELKAFSQIALSDADKQSWPKDGPISADVHSRAAKRLDLYHRDLVLKLMIALSSTDPKVQADARPLGLQLLRFLAFYMAEYYEPRNLAAFPEGQKVIGPGEYFAMGDNRYNSLDCRHFSQYSIPKNLVPGELFSLVYRSVNTPFSMKSDYLFGRELITIRM